LIYGAIDFSWDGNSPSSRVTPDYFMMISTGFIKSDSIGIHYFETISDNAVRVYLEDELVLNNWQVDFYFQLEYQKIYPPIPLSFFRLLFIHFFLKKKKKKKNSKLVSLSSPVYLDNSVYKRIKVEYLEQDGNAQIHLRLNYFLKKMREI